MEAKKCRHCGCTDEDCSQCIEKTGEPCYWVDETESHDHDPGPLCSACAKVCRMCGRVGPSCGGCVWIEELGNEHGDVCLACLQLFMGGHFQMIKGGGTPIYGNVSGPPFPGRMHEEVLRLVRLQPHDRRKEDTNG